MTGAKYVEHASEMYLFSEERSRVQSSKYTIVKPISLLNNISLLHLSVFALVLVPSHSFLPSKTVSFHTTNNIFQKTSCTESILQAKKLGLLTFDLDDTLYPIAPVVDEANSAFARAMDKYGYSDILPSDIVEMGKQVRRDNPEFAVTMTHTEVRRMAIRRKMEEFVYQNNLREVARDWGTDVSSLTSTVVVNARRWAETSVSESVVEAVLDAWEMERHHASERHLYPELIDVFQQIKEDHPDVIIGAVTDGKANPLLMTFTLAEFFDFCQSWEDDQSGRSKFFKDLDSVEGNADLNWIYDAAYDRYLDLCETREANQMITHADDDDEIVWIHVGDDLAYDVSGSASCGAKTIYCELDEQRYGQTARQRFDNLSSESQPSWSTNTLKELQNRKRMNTKARNSVTKTLRYLSLLPDALNDILDDEEEEDIIMNAQRSAGVEA